MDKLSKISLIPHAGLCNRMRAIASGIYFAKFYNTPIAVYWNKTHDCYAKFSDLFQYPNIESVCIMENHNPLYMVHGPRTLYVPKYLRNLFFKSSISGYSSNKSGPISANGMFKGNVVIESCCDIDNHYSINEIFIPTREILSKIENLIGSSSINMIGIHIRRTDNANSIASASIEDFMSRMSKEIDDDETTIFYLATDDPNVKNTLRQKFGERIISPDLCLSRSSVKGMKDAVADLYCLSRSKKIIGSYYSSYSEIAAEIGGIELEICKKNNL